MSATFTARAVDTNLTFSIRVQVPVTSVCPCSKAISDYGAHNQRGLITIEVWPRYEDDELALIWIEELVDVAERSASSPVFPLLKRADERHVTMQAYDNPVFVEDMVRNVAVALTGDARIAGFTVEAVNRRKHPQSLRIRADSVRLPWRTYKPMTTAAADNAPDRDLHEP